MSVTRSAVLYFLMAAPLAGCAHRHEEQRVDAKLSAEPGPSNDAELDAGATRAIETTPGLNDGERTQLLALRDSTRQQMQDYSQEGRKLRSLLIKDIITDRYDDNEVNVLKKKMSELSYKKVALVFDAIDKANVILGHKIPMQPRAQIFHEIIRPVTVIDI